MIKFFVGLLVVFFIALFEKGLYAAFCTSISLAYFCASVSLVFKVTEVIKLKSLNLNVQDRFALAAVLSGAALAIYLWGWNRQLILLLIPFLVGFILIVAVHLQVKYIARR